MRAIGVSPVYLHLLAWLTSDHRGKKPADMAGQRGGGGGRVDAQKCKHFISDTTEKGSFHSALDSKSQTLFLNDPKSNHFSQRFNKKLSFLEDNGDGWIEKLKPTMMKWCLLCLRSYPPTTNHSFWPGWRHPKLNSNSISKKDLHVFYLKLCFLVVFRFSFFEGCF